MAKTIRRGSRDRQSRRRQKVNHGDTERKGKIFSAFFSAALCVLRGKKTFNAEVAEECAEDAEKKILSVSLCLCGSTSFSKLVVSVAGAKLN
jgi:hypothetical protein